MAIQVIAGFKVGGTDPIDTRQVLTSEEMRNVDEKTMPNTYFCVNKENKNMYVYDKANEFDETYGKFKQVAGNGMIKDYYDEETQTLTLEF